MSSADPMSDSQSWTDLAVYTPGDYQPGRGKLLQLLWWYTSLLFFESGLFPFTGCKPPLLRLFGGKVGRGVIIKPHVRIKYPWRLEVGDHCWIGQEVWIDNIADVRIGSHVCVSQGVYFCTGSHDHRTRGFELAERPITVGDGAWLAAKSVLLPGVEVGTNALVAAGAVVAQSIPAERIAGGVPAQILGERPRPA